MLSRCSRTGEHDDVATWAGSKSRSAAVSCHTEVCYPFGPSSVGDLPWQPGDGIEFGAEADEFGLLKSSSRIRTFNEEVEDTTKIGEIQSALCSASRVVFLGFYFHPPNMELIKPSSYTTSDAEAYATALNRSSADVNLIMGQIARLRRFPACYIDSNWDWTGLFREFGTTWLG